ncbi:MAG: hypothetical protein ACKO04_10075, partial [Actinomycetes bacterium]
MSEPVPTDRPDLRLVPADAAPGEQPGEQSGESGAGGPGAEGTDVPAAAPADHGADADDHTTRDAPDPADASVEEPPEVTAARALLAGVDAPAFHRAMGKLARSSQSSILGPLPYSAAYGFHDPNEVAV